MNESECEWARVVVVSSTSSTTTTGPGRALVAREALKGPRPAGWGVAQCSGAIMRRRWVHVRFDGCPLVKGAHWFASSCQVGSSSARQAQCQLGYKLSHIGHTLLDRRCGINNCEYDTGVFTFVFLQVSIDYLPGDKNWLADHLSRKKDYPGTICRLDAQKEWRVRQIHALSSHDSSSLSCTISSCSRVLA